MLCKAIFKSFCIQQFSKFTWEPSLSLNSESLRVKPFINKSFSWNLEKDNKAAQEWCPGQVVGVELLLVGQIDEGRLSVQLHHRLVWNAKLIFHYGVYFLLQDVPSIHETINALQNLRRDGSVRGENFLGQKINFFLAMARNWYNLARNYTFRWEFVVFGETRLALARKNLE